MDVKRSTQANRVEPMAGTDREKALDAALAQIERQFGKGAVMRMGERSKEPIEIIPTGSTARPANGDQPAASATRADEVSRRDDELDVVMLERAWVEAIPRRDAAIVNRILTDDFEGIDLPLPGNWIAAIDADLGARRLALEAPIVIEPKQ